MSNVAYLPLHETAKNREVEEATLRKVAAHWGCEIRFCPPAYHVDAMLLRNGKFQAFVETRKRNNPKAHYPTFILSLQKFIALQELARFAPTLYVVDWEDGIGYYRIGTETPPVAFNTRKNPRDTRDTEPVVEIPVEHFKPIITRRSA